MPQYPGLDQMFQNLGPATASMYAGEQAQLAQDASLQEQLKQQQAIREAQLKNTQSEAMNPLLVTHQQLTNAGQTDINRKSAVDAAIAEAGKSDKIKTNASSAFMSQLEDKMKQANAHTQMLAQMIPQLNATPPAARYARMSQMAQQYGMPLDEQDLQTFKNIAPEKLPAFLNEQYQAGLNADKSYRQAMDVAKLHGETSKEVARIGASSREAVAAGKGNKGVQTIADAVKSGKMTAEKAAVALFGAAQFEEDPAKQDQLLNMAKQYETFAMNQRNAQAGGKVDIGAATGLPTQTMTPALGGGPKLGTAENPIKLK
jgi:hypothetical protein